MDQPTDLLPHAALDESIVRRFEVTTRRYAARTAVADTVRCLTYGELARLVTRIAAATARVLDVRPGPVAILLPLNVNFPAAMLGALAARRCYVPLDPGDPIVRNRLIAAQSSAAAVISAGELADLAHTLFPQLPVIDIDKIGDIAMPGVERPAPDDLAFIIYTSGSTGVPKGVYQNHRNLLHIAMQMTDALGVTEKDRVIAVRSPSSISATKEIFLALLNGASVHMASPLELKPSGLVSEMQRRNITILRMTPTLLRSIAEVPNSSEGLDTVRMVQLSAERIEWSDFDIFRRVFAPDARLSVLLNSTEADAACWLVDEAVRAAHGRLPVGYAIPDRCLTIVDDDGCPVKDGEVGEFVIKSRYVALGYWRDPEATARRFTVDRSNPELRIYQTGDLGRRRPDGLFEFVGRKDDQIKLRGHRIEIGEIEFALKGCAGVRDAAVSVRRNEAGLPRSLAAYVEPDFGIEDLTPRRLSTALRNRLPGYMIPTIAVMENLPRLPNLKIDRAELRRLDGRPPECRLDGSPPGYEAVGTNTEELLLDLWREVLDRPDIGYDDDFFLSGGDSFSAFDLMLRMEDRFQFQAPLTILAEAPTVTQLAHRIDALTTDAINRVIRIQTAGRRRPLFAAYAVGGHALALLPILRSLGSDQPCYWLQPPGMGSAGTEYATLPKIAAYYLEQIKTVQPHGPYRLIGNSFGGNIVFEVALQLQEIGESVDYLAIVDAEPVTCVFEDTVDVCDSSRIMRKLNARPQPVSTLEAETRRTLESQLRMTREHVLDGNSDRSMFRGELTYFLCTGNPIVARRDRRRLWQSFVSQFRLLTVPGIHGTPNREPQYSALRKLLEACLNDQPVTGIDPASVYDRDYRLDDRHQPKNIHGSMGDVYEIRQDRIQGFVDEIRIDAETIQITGWAVEPCGRKPAQTIAVFLDDQLLGYGAGAVPRPDVTKRVGAPSALFCGFDFIFKDALATHAMGRPRLFVLSSDGSAAELRGSIEPVATGSVKKLSNSESSGIILGGSWSSREQWGVWSDGSRASVIFDASSLPDCFTVAIRANLFPPVPSPMQAVRISDEGGNLLTIISNESFDGNVVMRMQKSFAQPGPWKSLIFDIDVQTSPQQLNISQDRRKLGIGLISLTFQQ